MYKGRVSLVPPQAAGKYGFIDLNTVTREDGESHGLDATKDIFIHTNKLNGMPVRQGMEMFFNVLPDGQRKGQYVAVDVRETEASGLAVLGAGGIELFVQGPGGKPVIESSSVFATWCLSPDLAPKLKELRLAGKVLRLLLIHWKARDIESPHDRHTTYGEVRHLIELSDPMAPIAFTASGRYNLVGLIVAHDSLPRLECHFLGKRRDEYEQSVIAKFGGHLDISSDFGIERLGSGCITVEMPEGLFAQRPFDWEWVNKFWKGKGPRDQCSYRWRRLFAYTLQPVWIVFLGICLAVIAIVKTLALVFWIPLLISCGVVNLYYEGALSPIDTSLMEILPENPRSLFVLRQGKRRILFPLAFSPIVMVVTTVWAWLTTVITTHSKTANVWSWADFGHTFLFMIGFWAGLTALIYLKDWSRESAPPKALDADDIDAELHDLICKGTGPRAVNVWQLALKPKNFRFIFLGSKQKVCKNFSST